MLGKLLRRPTASTAAPLPAETAELLRKVRRLDLRTRGFVESLFNGEYLSVFLGRGMEFSHVRGYQFGDDVRAIDWKVTARRGSAYVRQFVEERDMLVGLLVDVSASGRFGPGKPSTGEAAAEIAAALAFAATRNNDRVSLILSSDRVEHFTPPGSGRRHVVRLLSTLLSHRPRGRRTDLTAALERATQSFPGRATVFIISDFIQDHRDSSFKAALGRAARRHDIVAVRLSAAAADELPNVGWVEMTDPESGRRVVIDSGSNRVREHYRRSVQRGRVEMATALGDAGVEIVDIDTASDPLALLTAFFRRRAAVR